MEIPEPYVQFEEDSIMSSSSRRRFETKKRKLSTSSRCYMRRQSKFFDRIHKEDLIPISKIKTLFDGYDHNSLERYNRSIVWHDVGALIFLLYIKKKYNGLCDIPINFSTPDIDIPFEVIENETYLEWLERIDYDMDDSDSPKYLIYYNKEKFIYDPKLFRNTDKLQIHIVSHTFEVGSGHLGCIFRMKDKVYYYDSNGLSDCDKDTYYHIFEKNLSEEMLKYGITYVPYRWKRGIQCIQDNEESKYGMDIMGMCSSWTFLIIELKLMNPHLTIEEIENKLKKKYRFRLTRMIVTYQQEIHKVLSDLSKEYYKLNSK